MLGQGSQIKDGHGGKKLPMGGKNAGKSAAKV